MLVIVRDYWKYKWFFWKKTKWKYLETYNTSFSLESTPQKLIVWSHDGLWQYLCQKYLHFRYAKGVYQWEWRAWRWRSSCCLPTWRPSTTGKFHTACTSQHRKRNLGIGRADCVGSTSLWKSGRAQENLEKGQGTQGRPCCWGGGSSRRGHWRRAWPHAAGAAQPGFRIPPEPEAIFQGGSEPAKTLILQQVLDCDKTPQI